MDALLDGAVDGLPEEPTIPDNAEFKDLPRSAVLATKAELQGLVSIPTPSSHAKTSSISYRCRRFADQFPANGYPEHE